MDWGMIAGLIAGTALAVKVVDRIFTPRDMAVKEIAQKLQAHEVTDAAAFAELRSALAALSRDQLGVETRILTGIDAMRQDVRGVNERVDKILAGRQ